MPRPHGHGPPSHAQLATAPHSSVVSLGPRVRCPPNLRCDRSSRIPPPSPCLVMELGRPPAGVVFPVLSRCVLFLVGLALLGLFAGGCSRDDSRARDTEQGAADSGRSGQTYRTDILSADCAIGKHPDYFVPGGDRPPALLVGCARFGVSDKRAEFSVDLGRIDGEFPPLREPGLHRAWSAGLLHPCVLQARPSSSAFRGSRRCSATTGRSRVRAGDLGNRPTRDVRCQRPLRPRSRRCGRLQRARQAVPALRRAALQPLRR